jgi:hypothetical protein
MLRSCGSKRSITCVALPLLYIVWALRDSGNIQAMPASTPSPNIPLSDLYEDNQAIAKRPEPLSVRRQHEWLHRFKQWIGLDANLWKAKKVLGAGGNGVVGLWEYQGNNTLFPRNIVIKQGHDDPESMAWESKLLRQITGTGTEHVVKLYKGYHRDGGSGTSDLFDPRESKYFLACFSFALVVMSYGIFPYTLK